MAYTDSDRQYFYPNIIKKVTSAFLSLFTDIRIAKYDATGTLINYRDVPITFGSKQKFLLNLDKSTQFDFSQSLPRLGIIITGFNPHREKVQGSEIYKILNIPATSTTYSNVYSPSPYTIDFTVTAVSLHMSEMNQILEQILPFFNPFRTLTIKEFDFIPSFTRDIKVTLKDTVPNFMDDIPEDEIRKITWDLNFSVDCFLYKPMLVSTLITTIKTELIDFSTLSTIVSGQTTVPSGAWYGTYTYSVSGVPSAYTVITSGWTEY